MLDYGRLRRKANRPHKVARLGVGAGCRLLIGWLVLLFTLGVASAQQQEKGAVLVLAASSRDYLFGAGGTLAKMIDEGRPVYVLEFGNGEKEAVDLGPAEARLANRADAKKAAEALGVKEVLNLGHKSGEFGYISTSELRNQVMTMVRFYKPEILFFPDWYMHYLDDNDIYWVGRMAEESPYGGGDYFLQEMTWMGWGGYRARLYYFYPPYRPYRPREGGVGKASMKRVDITSTFERKVDAILELRTANQHYAVLTKKRLELAGQPTRLLNPLDDAAVDSLVRAYAEELAETIGEEFGARYGEEFNYLGTSAPIPAHVLERAVPIE